MLELYTAILHHCAPSHSAPLPQLLCHVVNRVGDTGRGCFSFIVTLEVPGFDSIHQFPMLAAAAGLLTALLKDDLQNRGVYLRDILGECVQYLRKIIVWYVFKIFSTRADESI